MKFLGAAQLPPAGRWMVRRSRLRRAVHTLDIPDGNRTTDARIFEIAGKEQRVVVTKDADFVDSHTLHRQPGKLLLVSTGLPVSLVS